MFASDVYGNVYTPSEEEEMSRQNETVGNKRKRKRGKWTLQPRAGQALESGRQSSLPSSSSTGSAATEPSGMAAFRDSLGWPSSEDVKAWAAFDLLHQKATAVKPSKSPDYYQTNWSTDGGDVGSKPSSCSTMNSPNSDAKSDVPKVRSFVIF